jgi:uncharacterized damage-inducible protein DinB
VVHKPHRRASQCADRLLTYLEGRQLTDHQMAELKSELDRGAHTTQVLAELEAKLRDAEHRVRRVDPRTFEEQRAVGRQKLPTTVAGLLVHIAEHTARHTGQAVTTAKIVRAARKIE